MIVRAATAGDRFAIRQLRVAAARLTEIAVTALVRVAGPDLIRRFGRDPIP